MDSEYFTLDGLVSIPDQPMAPKGKSSQNSDKYFVLVNKERRTIQPGEQVHNTYGNRCNKFLMLQYGFCFPDNQYDSYEFYVRLDASVMNVPLTELVDMTC